MHFRDPKVKPNGSSARVQAKRIQVWVNGIVVLEASTKDVGSGGKQSPLETSTGRAYIEDWL